MPFIEMTGIEDVKEKELLPIQVHTFVVTDTKSEDKGENGVSIRLTLHAEGFPEEDYQPIWHYISVPGSGDDKDKRQTKMLFAKRFLVKAGIPINGGFSEEDLQGAVLENVAIEASVYEGREGRSLIVPALPNE